jgi:hypothetical protein
MADIGLSAFSLFFMQSESLLAHQRHLEQGQGTSNCHTLFGMKKIPTGNFVRLVLDPVSPEALQPCFDQVIESAAADEFINQIVAELLGKLLIPQTKGRPRQSGDPPRRSLVETKNAVIVRKHIGWGHISPAHAAPLN